MKRNRYRHSNLQLTEGMLTNLRDHELRRARRNLRTIRINTDFMPSVCFRRAVSAIATALIMKLWRAEFVTTISPEGLWKTSGPRKLLLKCFGQLACSAMSRTILLIT